MTNMTLKELIEYERELCSLQQEYEGKLTKIYGENDSSNEKRDKFSSLELVEIADALEMNLILKDKAEGTEYIIDYPNELKYKPKRKKE